MEGLILIVSCPPATIMIIKSMSTDTFMKLSIGKQETYSTS